MSMQSCRRDLFDYQQIVLEKQTLDIFESLHADALVQRLGDAAEFVVFGVVTEYCVSCAVKGLLKRKRRVAVVRDAIETLAPKVGDRRWPNCRVWERSWLQPTKFSADYQRNHATDPHFITAACRQSTPTSDWPSCRPAWRECPVLRVLLVYWERALRCRLTEFQSS